jgi:hypothetical protein
MWTCRRARIFVVMQQNFCSHSGDRAYMSPEKVLYSIENKYVTGFLANSDGYRPGILLARVNHSTQSPDSDLTGFLPLPANQDSRADCWSLVSMLLIIMML